MKKRFLILVKILSGLALYAWACMMGSLIGPIALFAAFGYLSLLFYLPIIPILMFCKEIIVFITSVSDDLSEN